MNRIVGDTINVTMPEFVELQRIFETVEELSFSEDMNRCQTACRMLGLPFSKMIGNQWRVVAHPNINGLNAMNSTDTDKVLERFDQTSPALQREIVVELIKKLGKLAIFKEYVHARLDAMGIPTDPDEKLTAETGCRIGTRLKYIEDKINGNE